MKKLAIIGCAGIPPNYGGFERFADNLVDHLLCKHEITLFCSSKNSKRKDRLKQYKSTWLKYVPLSANEIQSMPYVYILIQPALFFADTLLILRGAGCSILPLVHLFTRKKRAVNIEMRLTTFSKIEHHLFLVGYWANSEYEKNLKLRFACYANLLSLNPFYGKKDSVSLRRNATVYINGHEIGGTNSSLVEALFLGLPICAFAFNRETAENKKRYFSSKEQVKGLAQNGGEIMKIANRRYHWSMIANKYDNLLQTVVNGIKKQPKVKFSDESKMKIHRFYQLIDQQCSFDLIQESYD
jgi:hypothetical protein